MDSINLLTIKKYNRKLKSLSSEHMQHLGITNYSYYRQAYMKTWIYYLSREFSDEILEPWHAVHRKQFKAAFRRLKHRPDLLPRAYEIINELELLYQPKGSAYFDESKEIFIMHYFKGYSVYRIEADPEVFCSQKEIDRRLNYILDLYGQFLLHDHWDFPFFDNSLKSVYEEIQKNNEE